MTNYELFRTFVDAMKVSNIILKILMPLLLGAGILYWMYCGEDWQTIVHVATDETNMDAVVVPLWHLGTSFSRVALATDAGACR